MNALEIKNLKKTFKGFTLDNISFTLPSGCILGLIGENGAGKSTTIKLILNMLRRDSGEITIMGRDNREDFQAQKERIGVVFDEPGFPECVTAQQVDKIMKHTYKHWDRNLYWDYIKQFDLPSNLCFKEFSRGMKMKLSIAVALAHHPNLLILDEATSGLDPVVRDEVLDIFYDFTRAPDHSILISSHIVSDLEKLCDYIVFLRRGQILLNEEKDRILERYGILHCTEAELKDLDPAAVKGKKVTSYGVEAVVSRELIPASMHVSPASIEDIFVYMSKEGK